MIRNQEIYYPIFVLNFRLNKMSRMYHPEHREMKDVLSRNEITEIYHFTSINNLSSIINEGGLLSINELRNKRLENSINHGGNKLSLNLNGCHETLDYIKLSFRKKLPMAYRVEREQHIVILIIDPDVVLLDGVILTSENSVATNCIRDSGLSGLSLVDFPSIKDELSWRDPIKKKSIQAEILVPDRIRLEKIKKIYCISKSSLEEANRLCLDLDCPPMCVDSSYFFGASNGFFHTKDATLTNEIISRENVNSKRFSNITTFSIDHDNQVSILVKMQTIPNLKYEFIWESESGEIIQKKQSSSRFKSPTSVYFVWNVLESDKMRCGDFNVSFFLNNIRQFTIQFKIKED